MDRYVLVSDQSISRCYIISTCWLSRASQGRTVNPSAASPSPLDRLPGGLVGRYAAFGAAGFLALTFVIGVVSGAPYPVSGLGHAPFSGLAAHIPQSFAFDTEELRCLWA
jgi:hypothetical protein